MGLNIFAKKKADTTAVASVAPPVEKTKPTGEKAFVEGLVSTKDIIAPGALEVDFNEIRINNKYYRTCFIAGYPRFVGMNWLSPLINFDASLSVSMYIYPTDGKQILDDLRRKIAEMEAEISTDIQRGRVVNPTTQAKLEDALNLQADLAKGEERFFQFGLYVTMAAETKDDLNRITKNLEAALGALMISSKKSTLQMEEGFITTLPLGADKLQITRNMDTTSLATTFPFVSSDLSDDKGIMYGINEHNGSLVIFDRFSMPNYNSVVFATAGAGKSYLIKLEVMRSLMLGTEIIVIDPENEYKDLCESVGGQYVAFGYSEPSKINPFDLSLVTDEGENALNSKILDLHKLLKIMIGEMDPIEESILDRAVMDAYKMKGITPDPETQNKEPPLIEDLYKSLIGMEEEKARGLSARIEKYIKGSFAGIFNQKTTVSLNNKFVVFGIRNLEDALRPVAMQIILDYIWTTVKKNLKKRILVVDEAWYLMQYDDSAAFLRGIVKRGRKYYLGVTTITQDVDDFLQTPYGKEIVTNSSIQILLKQHSAAIDMIGDVFYLSEGEKQLLMSAAKGEGIFFAGQNHVAIRVIASEEEHLLITSNPEEVMKIKNQRIKESANLDLSNTNITKPEPAEPAPVIQPNDPVVPVDPTPTSIPTPVVEPSISPVPVVPAPVAQTPVVPVVSEPSKPRFVTEVVGVPQETSHEELLSKKINEMEELEKAELAKFEEQKKIDDEKKKKEEEEKAKMGGFGGSSFGGLPKYGDLFKSAGKLPPLPPLPPLPKYQAPTVNNQTISPSETDSASLHNNQIPSSKQEDKKTKPIFVDMTEKQIPQPLQLQKKAKPIFEESTNLESGIKKDNKNEEIGTKKDDKVNKSYDELFGNGIV
ncbi:MAG: ATP-binding protein [Candidatus Shapirobacteria bacterium]|jgi:hypothetical protein